MTATVEHLLAMPRIYDDLWAERGPALKAAALAVVEAEAAAQTAWAGPGWGGPE